MSLASVSGTIPFLKRGATGRTPKFMGVYSPDVTYTSDDYVAPLVIHAIYKVDGDPTSGIKSTDYYIMFGDNYQWTGKNEKTTPWEEATKKNDDPTKRWSLFAGFSTIAAEIAFIRFGLMAGAVMAQEGDARNGYTYAKMFSQTGQDGTTNYEKFKPEFDAWSDSQEWKPTLCLDFLKGTTYQKLGVIGGFDIKDYELTNERKILNDKGNVISYEYNPVIITVKNKNNDGTVDNEATLGNRFSAVLGYEPAAYFGARGKGDSNNVALKIVADGSTSPYLYGGYQNICIEAVGGVHWKMGEKDHWCMPGCLYIGCIYLSSETSLSLMNEWGNGCYVSGIVRRSAGMYRVYHDIGHAQYVVMAISSDQTYQNNGGAWTTCMIAAKTTTTFDIAVVDVNRGAQDPTSVYFAIFGRQGINS